MTTIAEKTTQNFTAEYGELTVDLISPTGDKSKTRKIKVPVFAGIEPAKVSYSAGLTLSGPEYGVSQYNPIKIHVSVSMPCLPEESSVTSMLETVKGWTETFLAKQEAELRVE